MGIGIGAIVSVLGAIADYAAAHAVITSIVVGALQAGISYTISALTAPKPPGPLSQGIDRIRNIQRDPQAPGRVYYGHGFGSGYLVYARVTNDKGKPIKNARYLHSCLIVAVGPIAGITKYHLNDEDDISKFGDLVSFVPFVGAWDQPMFKGPVGIRRVQVELPQEWLKENRPLSGIAYVWMTMAAHPTVFPGGPPSVRMEIDGAIIYDPRSPAQKPDDPYTWEFTNNWAVCVYDYLTNKEYGRAARHDQVCIDCFLESAGISDQDTPAPSNREHEGDAIPFIKRYTIDGSFETNEQPVDIMTQLAAAAAGTITFYDGQWHIRAGAPRATMLDLVSNEKVILTADNLRDDDSIQINVRPGRKEAANIVRGSFVSPKDKFTVQDFPEQTHPDFVKEDGGVELATNLELPYCLEVDRAQRLGRISLYMGRLGMRVTFPGGPELLQIPPWEVIELAFPEYGWGEYNDDGVMVPNIEDPTNPIPGYVSYKQFYVADRHFNENGGINLILAEYSNAMYSDTINPALLPERSDLPDPFAVFPPENVAVEEAVYVLPDGTKVSKLVLTWEPPEDGYSDSYTVIWRKDGSLDPYMSRTVPGDMLMTEIVGLDLGRYEIQIQTRVLSKLSAPVTVYGVVTYDAAPPPNPTNFRVSISVTDTRQFSWDVVGGIEPTDLRGYEIRFVKGMIIPEWDDARIFQQNIRQQMFETRQPIAEGTYTFLLKSLDLTGTYSEEYAVAQITILPREATDLANREYSEELWPGTLADCRINGRNQLVGVSRATWGTSASWAAMDTWAKGAMRLVYIPPSIILTKADFVTFEFKVEGSGIAGYYVQTRLRTNTEDDLSQFVFRTGGSGREFQFRLIAWNDGTTPLVIDKFYATMYAKDETDRRDGINMTSAQNDPVRRIENTSALSSTGEVQHINATPQGITIDSSTWARMLASGYITLPLFDAISLGGTFEITVAIESPVSQARIIGRGTDWGINYSLETVGGKPHGIFRLNATGAAGPFVPLECDIGELSVGVYDIVVTNTDGTIAMYVNRRVVGTIDGPVIFAQTSNPIAIGARVVSGVVANRAAITVKECRIWRIALLPDEINAYSGVAIDPTTPGLIGYWRLDDDFNTTTVVKDRGPDGLHGTAHEVVESYYLGSRFSPPIDMAILPKWANGLRGSYAATIPAGGIVTVYMGIGVGDNPPLTWVLLNSTGTTNVDTSGTLPSGSTPPVGYKVWCLQMLRAPDAASRPTLTQVTTEIAYPATAGHLVIQPPHAFSEIRQASLTIHADLVRPMGWHIAARDPVGVRFFVFDPAGGITPRDATVDVLFQGSRIYP